MWYGSMCCVVVIVEGERVWSGGVVLVGLGFFVVVVGVVGCGCCGWFGL